MTDSPFLDCEVLCFYQGDEVDEKLKNLGISIPDTSTDAWWPFVIDLREVVALRMPAQGKDGNPCEKECVVYIQSDHFTINVPYKKVRARWMKIKKGSATNTTL